MEEKRLEMDPVVIEIEASVENSGDSIKSRRLKTPAASIKSKKQIERCESSNLLKIDRENVLRGIIFSEIFGRPLARRKR